MHPIIEKLNPKVDKRFLIFLAGTVWSVVGFFLCGLAFGWLAETKPDTAKWLGAGGIIFSLLIHHLGFLRLVKRNIKRILSLEDKICIFAFQTLKSYLIILIMIAMGMALRHSAIPKPYLSVIYIGFGGAMLLSSIRYFWEFFSINLKP